MPHEVPGYLILLFDLRYFIIYIVLLEYSTICQVLLRSSLIQC